MTTPAPETSAIDVIVEQLKASGLTCCEESAVSQPQSSALEKALARLLSKEVSRGFVSSATKLQLTVDKHFDLAVDVLIKDSELASLGIVHVVPQRFVDHIGDPIDFNKWCRQRIDEAVYLRHILLTNTRDISTRARPLAYTVELCLAFPQNRERELLLAGDVLRDLKRYGSFLHAVGVNLWPLAAPIHEGLPWLLTATRVVMADLKSMRQSAERRPSPMGFGRLALEDFRLPHRREMEFDSDSVHLVHGPNGTGKSAIVEAIELAITGKIARLERRGESVDYALVLRNRDAKSSTPVKIELSGAEPMVVGASGVPNSLDRRLNADGFRLNQDLADRLAAGSSGERAATFVAAFFPDKAAGLESRRKAIVEFDEALKAVPDWAQSEAVAAEQTPNASTVLQKLNWLDANIRWERVILMLQNALGLTDRTELLNQMQKGDAARFDETGGFDANTTLTRAQEMDTALNKVRQRIDAAAQVLPGAITILEKLGSRTIGKERAQTDDIPALFNAWLEAVAEADMAARISDVVRTISLAKQNNSDYESKGEFGALLAIVARKWDVNTWRTIEDYSTGLGNKAQDLYKQLSGIGAETRDARMEDSAGSLLPPLQQFSFEALDDVAARGLLGPEFEHCQPPIGQAVRMAFEGIPRVVEVRNSGKALTKVGESGWAGILLERLRRAQSSHQHLAKVGRVGSLFTALDALQKLRTQAKALEAQNTGAEQELVKLLTGLSPSGEGILLKALNEVKALLTPARWAYPPLRASVDLGPANSLDLKEQDNVSIPQRLNTAELNSTALAFFLLCARNVENPLRVLVFDDPLQNMDELTVIAVARAFAKILRLWNTESVEEDPKLRWHVLLLLHSEDDVERFRNEVPCAYYRLPWLRPHGTSEASKDTIVNEGALLGPNPQDLADLISA